METTSDNLVPNQFPDNNNLAYRIALVGEAPGKDEDLQRKPFVGCSGQLLCSLLRAAGIERSSCYVGNVFQYRPPKNKLHLVDPNDPKIAAGRQQLIADLTTFKPQVIIPLGETALRQIAQKKGIHNWRGSFLRLPETAQAILGNPWIVPTLHPAYVLRNIKEHVLPVFDFIKAKRTLAPNFDLPKLEIDVDPPLANLQSLVNKIQSERLTIAFDIETTIKEKKLLCIGFAYAPTKAIVISNPTEPAFYILIKSLLEDPNVPKVAQNAQFDMGVLRHFYGINTQNLIDDTMLMHHNCYAELPKSLGFICSIYTDMPYYKHEGKKDAEEQEWSASDMFDMRRLFIYNGKDCCATYMAWEKLKLELERIGAVIGYRRDMTSLPIALDMTLRGVLIDESRRLHELAKIEEAIAVSQAALNTAFKEHIPPPEKRFSKWKPIPKSWRDKAGNLKQVDPETHEVCLEKGEYRKRLKDGKQLEINSKSNKILSWLLYDVLHLPKQYMENEEGEIVVTVNAGALLNLVKISNNPNVYLILKDRQLRTQKAFYEIDIYKDGRIHPAFKVGGTETGRWSSSSSILGGRNLMNIPTERRHIYCADPGYTLINFDQSQAEARYVAYKAYVCTGDASYKNLLESGKKPHIWFGNILCDRHIFPESARAFINAKADKDIDPHYYISKKSIHGFSYGLGPKTFCDMLLEETDGSVVVEQRTAKIIREALFDALPAIPSWHAAVQRRLTTTKTIISAMGRLRVFLDRKGDSLWKEAYAFEPQGAVADNTATIMDNLLKASPYFQMLQQGYDSVLCQVPTNKLEEAITLVRQHSQVPITIPDFDNLNRITIVIPISIKVGTNWGELVEI